MAVIRRSNIQIHEKLTLAGKIHRNGYVYLKI